MGLEQKTVSERTFWLVETEQHTESFHIQIQIQNIRQQPD
jgi:hypothetical protein